MAPCGPCGHRTKHAQLVHNAYRDYDEIEQHIAVDGWPVPDGEVGKHIDILTGKPETEQRVRTDMHRSYWAKVEKDLAGGTIGQWSGSVVWID